MGPPPRSFAADAHDCIMVRVVSRPAVPKLRFGWVGDAASGQSLYRHIGLGPQRLSGSKKAG